MQGRVKQLRLHFGLDQPGFAELLGIPVARVEAWESGAVPLATEDVERFVQRFDVSRRWFSGEDVPIWGERLLRVQERLREYVRSLSGIHMIQMITATTGERIAYVLRHLQDLEPSLGSVECLACWLGLSSRSLEMLLREELDPGTPVIARASDLTGIAEDWFRTGTT